MRILFVTTTVFTVLSSAGLMAAQWWPWGSDEETELRLENQQLRSVRSRLSTQNARLSADNENLQEQVNELEIQVAEQAGSDVEIERLRGERERARSDLAAERARGEQLDAQLGYERETRIRLEERLRDDGNSGAPGWLAFLVVLLLASVAIWREWWWRSRILMTAPHVRVVQPGTGAIAPRGTGRMPAKVDEPNR